MTLTVRWNPKSWWQHKRHSFLIHKNPVVVWVKGLMSRRPLLCSHSGSRVMNTLLSSASGYTAARTFYETGLDRALHHFYSLSVGQNLCTWLSLDTRKVWRMKSLARQNFWAITLHCGRVAQIFGGQLASFVPNNCRSNNKDNKFWALTIHILQTLC